MNPFFRYVGGKRFHHWLGTWVKDIHAVRPFTAYCEPFVGAGGVFWQILPWLKCNRISVRLNDADPSTVALWNAMMHHTDAFLREVQFQFSQVSEKRFYHQRDTILPYEQDMVRLATARLYLICYSFRGGCLSPNFKGLKQRNTLPLISTVLDKIRRARRALEGLDVMVTCRSFEEVLSQPRRQFLYLDPPYFVTLARTNPTRSYYRYGLTLAQHEGLASLLKGHAPPWLLSYDDHPHLRRLYKWAFVGGVNVKYRCTGKIGEEVVVMPKEQERAV